MSIVKTIGFPGKYIQGPRVLENISQLSKPTIKKSDKIILLGDEIVFKIAKNKIISSFQSDGKECVCVDFNGESTEFAINNVKEQAIKFDADCIIGVGGGKAIDTARGAAFYLNKQLIVVPTIAATDAPISSLVGVYDENHTYLYTIRTGKNPDLVLVDSEIILEAPTRFLIAGMGDALSTKFETEAAFKKKAFNIHGGSQSQTSLAISDLSFRLILEFGQAAVKDALSGKLTDNVERVIEANILLSGIGFESGGLAAAHGLQGAFTVLPDTVNSIHGEKVAFSTLVQLKMEIMKNCRNRSVFDELLKFYKKVGLPLSLVQLGIKGSQKEIMDKVTKVARKACDKNGYIHNMPFNIEEEFVYEAIIDVDREGSLFKDE